MALTILYNGTVHTGITTVSSGTVIIEDGRILDVISNKRFHQRRFPSGTKIYDLEGMTVMPGMIDTHIHGLHGSGTDDGSADAVLAMSEALVQYGVTSFCPTLYPGPEDFFVQTIENTVGSMGQEQGASNLGMHLEGPFINVEKKGVQREEYIRGVSMELMDRFYQAAKGNVSIMTVAPELKGMRELAVSCVRQGTVLSAGHTNAEYENMVEGFEAGILHATHMFNAMKGLHHRNPGVVGALLLHKNVSVELIADGFHVHPSLIELLLRSKPVDKVVLVTDALKPTEQKEGTLIANGEEVYLNEDGIFKRIKDNTIAGSSLTLNKGVRNLVKWGIPVSQAIQMASTNPADLLNQDRRRGYLLPNSFADLVVMDQNFNAIMTFVQGEVKFDRNKYPFTVQDIEGYSTVAAAHNH